MLKFVDMLEAVLPIDDPVVDTTGLVRRLSRIAGHFGFRHTSYMAIAARADGNVEIEYFTTYPEAWTRRYLEKGYQAIDPVVDLTRNRVVPLDWGAIDVGLEPVREFFGEAREFGIGRQGLSMPIRGPHHEAALFSVTVDCGDDEWVSLHADVAPFLPILGHEVHKIASEILRRPSPGGEIGLSRREIECLKWASMGKTTWETARILAISERTVKFHLTGAAHRLDCSNKTHAVSRAIRLGLI